MIIYTDPDRLLHERKPSDCICVYAVRRYREVTVLSESEIHHRPNDLMLLRRGTFGTVTVFNRDAICSPINLHEHPSFTGNLTAVVDRPPRPNHRWGLA